MKWGHLPNILVNHTSYHKQKEIYSLGWGSPPFPRYGSTIQGGGDDDPFPPPRQLPNILVNVSYYDH